MTTKTQEATSSKAATGHTEKEFKPIIFGGINPVKERKVMQYYADLCRTLNSIIELVDTTLFGEAHPFEIDFVIDLLQQQTIDDKRRFIFRKHVKLNGINVPGIDTEQLIDKGLIDLQIPIELEQQLVKVEHTIKEYELRSIGFAYPLRKLYRETSSSLGVFVTDEQFDKAFKAFHQQTTDTPEQNAIYNDLRTIANRLNNLCAHGVLSINKLEQFIDLTIDNDRFNNEKPFSVSPYAFRRNFMGEHRIQSEESLPLDLMFA